jgi:PAS domain S-box-containing protein
MIALVNRQAEAMFGYPRREMLGQPIELLIPQRYHDKHVGYRVGYFADPSARPMGANLNLFGRRKDGHEFPVEISLSPLATDEGVLVSGSIRDVTQSKQIEQDLRASEGRFRALTQSINDAVVSTDTAGVIVFWNKSAQAIFGYTEAEAVGQPLTLLMPEPFQDAHVGKVIELVGRRKNGAEFPLELSLAAWHTEQGLFFSGVLRDITRRKKSEAALEE